MPPESQESAPIEETQEQAEESSLTSRIKENRGVLIGFLVAMAFMGLCLFPIFLYLIFRSSGEEILGEATATPFPTSIAQNLPVQTPIVIGIGGDTGTISTTVDIPATLTLNGRSFTVQPQLIPTDGGAWTADVEPDSVAWGLWHCGQLCLLACPIPTIIKLCWIYWVLVMSLKW